jgi:YgiT-type zinc finger domain-containing protein
MTEKRCPTCGSTEYETRLVEYVYRHDGNYLIVRDVPAEVCTECGTRFYRAEVLEEIERRFFAIYREAREPEGRIEVPVETYQPA